MTTFYKEHYLLIPIFLNIVMLILTYSSLVIGLLRLKKPEKISKKRKLSFLAIAAIMSVSFTYSLLPSICLKLQYLSEPKNLYHFDKSDIYIRGNPNEFQIAEIAIAFQNMNSNVSNAIKIISFREEEHFNSIEHEAAHVGCGKGVFCAPATGFTDHSVIEHETAHLYSFSLGKNFIQAWELIAGEIYGKYTKKDSQHFIIWAEGDEYGPRHGCMNAYGSTNVDEDIAIFYEDICDLLSSKNERDFILLKNANSQDKRYEQKIALLYQYGFISNQEYRKIKKYLHQ